MVASSDQANDPAAMGSGMMGMALAAALIVATAVGSPIAERVNVSASPHGDDPPNTGGGPGMGQNCAQLSASHPPAPSCQADASHLVRVRRLVPQAERRPVRSQAGMVPPARPLLVVQGGQLDQNQRDDGQAHLGLRRDDAVHAERLAGGLLLRVAHLQRHPGPGRRGRHPPRPVPPVAAPVAADAAAPDAGEVAPTLFFARDVYLS